MLVLITNKPPESIIYLNPLLFMWATQGLLVVVPEEEPIIILKLEILFNDDDDNNNDNGEKKASRQAAWSSPIHPSIHPSLTSGPRSQQPSPLPRI